MEAINIDFRIATPDDADSAVPLIYSSGPAAFDYAFIDDKNSSALIFLKRAFRECGSALSHQNHTVATHNDIVVGVGARLNSAKGLSTTLSTVRQLLPHYGMIRGGGVIRRGLKLEHLFALPKKQKGYIAHLGVLPELQSCGIGRKLLQILLKAERQAGRTHAILDVSVKNPRARTLYESIGFVAVEERQSTVPGVPNHWRMELTL